MRCVVHFTVHPYVSPTSGTLKQLKTPIFGIFETVFDLETHGLIPAQVINKRGSHTKSEGK